MNELNGYRAAAFGGVDALLVRLIAGSNVAAWAAQRTDEAVGRQLQVGLAADALRHSEPPTDADRRVISRGASARLGRPSFGCVGRGPNLIRPSPDVFTRSRRYRPCWHIECTICKRGQERIVRLSEEGQFH